MSNKILSIAKIIINLHSQEKNIDKKVFKGTD